MSADSSSNLEIVISAIDEASAAFDEVSASLEGLSEAADASTAEISASMEGSATVITTGTQEIEGSLDAWQAAMFSTGAAAQAMTDEVALSFQEFTASEEAAAEESAAASEEIATSSALTKGSFTSIGVVAALAFAAVASAVSGAVSSAQGWDEESAIISQTLKDTGSAIPLSQVQEYAQHVQSITLLTQQQALQSQGLILSYKDLQPNYQSLTLLSADLATKMSQASGTMTDNLPNATKILVNALEDPVAGINQLIRQGTVAFPVATVTMIENMAKVGDTAGADALILETLNGKVGGMAQAAAQAPGAGLTQLSNSLTSLGTQVGNDLLPDLDALAKALLPIITDITNWAAEHPKLTEALVAGVVVFTALLAILTVVGLVVAAVGSAFAAAAVSIAAVVAVLVAVIVANWQTIKDDTETVWNGISAFFTSGWSWEINLFKTSFDAIQNIWNTAWNGMSTILGDIWTTIQNTVKTGIDYVISAINGFINALDAIHISIPSISIPGTKLATPSINLGFSIPDIPMLADGGFVTQPTLAIIGEAGPEAVMPLSSMNANGGGFSGQQIIVNITGGYYLDQQAATQIGNTLAKQIVQQIRVKNYAF
jgi:hypothetical protein